MTRTDPVSPDPRHHPRVYFLSVSVQGLRLLRRAVYVCVSASPLVFPVCPCLFTSVGRRESLSR